MRRQLVESDLFEYKVKTAEGQLRNGVLAVIGGLGQRADEENANKRIYSKSLWERILPEVQDKIKNRQMVGELDHPEGEGSVKNISHVVTEAKLASDGTVYVEMEVLNTPQGQILKSLIEAGVKLGISSRGEGELINREGKEYVAEDSFILDTWDVVINPSTRGAYPDVIAQRESEARRVLRSVEATCNRNGSRSVLLEAKRIVSSLKTKKSEGLKRSVLQTIERKLSTPTTGKASRKPTKKVKEMRRKTKKLDPSTGRVLEATAHKMASQKIARYRKALGERNAQIVQLSRRVSVAEKRLVTAIKIMNAMKEKAKTIAIRSGNSTKVGKKYNELARRHAAAKAIIEDQHSKLSRVKVLEKRHNAALDIIDGFYGIHEKAKLRAFVESKVGNHPAAKQILEMCVGVRNKKDAVRIIENAKQLLGESTTTRKTREPLPGTGFQRPKLKVTETAEGAKPADPMMRKIMEQCDRPNS